jgi:hypothetical protein
MGKLSILSPSLIDALKEKNMHLLHQARSVVDTQSTSLWLSSAELNLNEALGKEWNTFRRNLIDSGAFIQDREDELIWTGGDNSGLITIKNIY